MTAFHPHPDRLFPADPATRRIARSLYDSVATLPIISPHGHVTAAEIAANQPYPDPAALLITGDHYITRMLFSGARIDPGALGRGQVSSEPRTIWRFLADNWYRYLGTPVRYWMEHQLSELFDVTEELSPDNADAIFDQIDQRLTDPLFRPHTLLERFRIEVLATTDDPTDDLAHHRQLAAQQGVSTRVLPTWRADRFMDPSAPTWLEALADLENSSPGIDARTYRGMLAGLRHSRDNFRAHGATATDAGVLDAGSHPLADTEAEAIHAAGLAGNVTAAQAVAYRCNLLYRFAEMSCEDGLVMQLHPGVIRNHHVPTWQRFGPDVGADLPDSTSYTRALTPLLNAFGDHPRLHLVLFTVDETAFSRDIGPLAGFYPAVYVGVPWWFLDTPAAILRFRDAVTDSAGYYKGSGFIDDTRAFLSIPARHDMARRLDAHHLAQRVVTHQLSESSAGQIIHDLHASIPKHTFKL